MSVHVSDLVAKMFPKVAKLVVCLSYNTKMTKTGCNFWLLATSIKLCIFIGYFSYVCFFSTLIWPHHGYTSAAALFWGMNGALNCQQYKQQPTFMGMLLGTYRNTPCYDENPPYFSGKSVHPIVCKLIKCHFSCTGPKLGKTESPNCNVIHHAKLPCGI